MVGPVKRVRIVPGVHGEDAVSTRGRSPARPSCSRAIGSNETATQGRPLELDAMGVVDDAIEDRVGQVGSPITSCQRLTGTWLVISSEPRS
jgi:hypothetical protein